MKPLFIWAGGKNKMLKKYQEHLPLSFSSYHEPFCGGGAMFIWAYKKNPDAKFFLNDINSSIMSIYSSIKEDVEPFIFRMDELSKEYLPLSKEDRKAYYFSLRHEHAYEYEKWDKTEEAATLYFLMKTGFNGIWQINKNTNGRYGTPAGLLNQKDKVYDRENVMLWHEALQKCELTSFDFSETMPKIGSGSYVFLDPPYRGCFTDYGTQSDDEFQRRVVDFFHSCSDQGAYALLSNRKLDDGFFENLKKDATLVDFPVTYTAGRRKKTDEGFEAKKATEVLLVTTTKSQEEG
jgi:DNA adenine methylase